MYPAQDWHINQANGFGLTAAVFSKSDISPTLQRFINVFKIWNMPLVSSCDVGIDFDGNYST